MSKNKLVKQHKSRSKVLMFLYCLATSMCVGCFFLVASDTFSARRSELSEPPLKSGVSPTPANVVSSKNPHPPTQITRIKIAVGETQDFSVPGFSAMASVLVISPEVAAAQTKNGNNLTITGLKTGETILIVSDNLKRQTFIVEVGGRNVAARRAVTNNEEGAKNENPETSGSYSVTFVKGFDEAPSLLRNDIEFRRRLSDDRTLRVSGEIFNLIGKTDKNQALANFRDFGFNRLTVGIDSPRQTIDLLDSQVNVSSLGFNNFPMRGFHLVRSAKSSGGSAIRQKGVEVFAGLARPSSEFYSSDRGKIAGAFVPVTDGETWQVRAGVIRISPEKHNRTGRGGTIFQVNSFYTPNEKFSVDGEASFANGAFSWRGRVDLKLRQFGASAEISRLDKDSPFNSVGAQPGGRQTELFSFYWRSENRFNFSASYHHTAIKRLVNSGLTDFDRSAFLVNASFRINRNSRLTLRFLDQQIETAIPGGQTKFRIETWAIVAGYNLRFNQNWSNSFEARLNFSREAKTGDGLENGFNLNEQLRFSWGRNAFTGFFNYNYKTPSLTSLIFRNPQILPPLLQEAFISNPAQFLNIYRDQLRVLLGGVELPQTRSLDTGLRFQTKVSRFTLTGETRYNAGEVFSLYQKNLSTFAGLNVKLDAANSLQINGGKIFGGGGQSSLTFSYTHRFGAGSGDGLQFSKLLGFDKGRVQGRVFYDLNENGRDDAGEPGVAGVTVQISEKRSVKTDANGRYEVRANEGGYNITLISNDLGVRLRATSNTQQKIFLYPRETVSVNFGVTDLGFLTGRVFNDLTGDARQTDAPGIGGVRIILRSVNGVTEQVTDGSGKYEFLGLRPGIYTVEIDATTLPPNFRLPEQTIREIKIEPLQGFYLDIPVAAQRAVTGIIFVDRNLDGRYDSQKDDVVERAMITDGKSYAISDRNGEYILRNLPPGKIKIVARAPYGNESSPVFITLGIEPVTKRAVNIAVRR